MKHTNNIIGAKYREIEIIRSVGGGNYLAKCSCGNELIIHYNDFIEGKVWACRDCTEKAELEERMQHTNPIGKRFGDLVVIGRVKAMGLSVWECECDCGGRINVKRSDLFSGRVTHCNSCKPSTDVTPKHRSCKTCIHNPILRPHQVMHYCECVGRWAADYECCGDWKCRSKR